MPGVEAARQGLSEFRCEIARGVHFAVDEWVSAGVYPNYMLFFMYTETLKYVAENSGPDIRYSWTPTHRGRVKSWSSCQRFIGPAKLNLGQCNRLLFE